MKEDDKESAQERIRKAREQARKEREEKVREQRQKSGRQIAGKSPAPPKSKPASPSPAKPASPPPSRAARPPSRSTPRPAPKPGITSRMTPAARADARRAKIEANPLPAPPPRRTTQSPPQARTSTVKTAPPANAELQARVASIQNRYASLETSAQLSDVYASIGDIDAKLTSLPLALESVRSRGYVHSGQLEARLAAIDDRWDDVRPRVESTLRVQVRQLTTELDQTEQVVGRISAPNATSVTASDTAINSLSRRVDAARSSIGGLYDGMEDELRVVESDISRISKMLDQLQQSPEIHLRDTEGPLSAVDAVWQQDGKEGPEGILFLTDQRLLFEQREEVATKKFLGVLKMQSENIQKLLLDVAVPEIESVTHKEEGGFLGMGKDDILELVLAASAPVSRVRLHLKGQDSADWATMIKRVQSNEINQDRAEQYREELASAGATAASFPTQCPGCFAPVSPPARGVTSVICEFCGTVIIPSGNIA